MSAGPIILKGYLYGYNYNMSCSILYLDIVGRVRNRETMPCRPEVFSEVKEVHSAVAKLMQLCWIDNEFERPSFGNIRSYIKKNIHGM